MSNERVAKLHVLTLEGPSLDVTAQYNPKELSVDKSVPWQKHKDSKADQPNLEFTGADGRSLGLELTFDGFEDGTNVHTTYVDKLVKMGMTMPSGEKRPPKVKVTWNSSALPDFIGVIESVSTKYTMFLADGTPVRATCTLKLKEADKLSIKKGQ
jgi:hypothetical protein